jgi:hypothetical protein
VVADVLNLDAYLTPGITGQLAFEWSVPLDDCEGPTYLMFLDDTTAGAFPFHGVRQGVGTIVSSPVPGVSDVCNEQPAPALSVDASVIAAGLSSVRVAIRSIEPAGADMSLLVSPRFNEICPVE